MTNSLGRILTTGAAALAICGAALAAGPQTFVETFDGDSSNGGWTWGAGDTFADIGGNPGAFLETSTLVTFAPTPRTTAAESEFTGDFRARGVTSVGVDLVTNAASNSTGGRPCTLMLVYDNGTPGDFSDDSAAYFLGANIPHVGQGWVSYDFDVPSSSTTLPSGWALINLGNIDDPAIHTWDEIIQNVTRTQFHYGHPEFFFLLQDWELGMDNARITTEAPPEVIYETDDPFGSFLGINGFDVFENQSVAVRFAPDGAYDLHSVGLWLWNNDPVTPQPITITLRPDATDPKIGSIPSDTILETWNFIVPADGPFNPQLFTFESVEAPFLMDGVNYWLVAESDTQGQMDPVWAWAGKSAGESSTTNFFTGEWQPLSGGAVPATLVMGTPSMGPLGDLNGDGVVNGADLAAMLAQWGTGGSADLNNDDVVDGADLATLLANWTG